MPDRDLEEYQTVLSYADAKALRYYLPAYMRWTLRYGETSGSHSSNWTIGALNPSKGSELQDYFLARIADFTDAQCRTICRFLEWIVEFDDGRLYLAAEAAQALAGYWDLYREPRHEG